MPVSGPNKYFSDQRGSDATKNILELLSKEYNIESPHLCLPLSKKFKEDWDEQVKKLEEVVKELAWIDACASW